MALGIDGLHHLTYCLKSKNKWVIGQCGSGQPVLGYKSESIKPVCLHYHTMKIKAKPASEYERLFIKSAKKSMLLFYFVLYHPTARDL